jgi:hypothetical protein
MSQFDLTTTAKVKEYLGITDSTYDTVIDTIVTSTSCEMEIYCNRQFELDIYIQQDIGEGEDIIRLPNTPIDSVLYAATGSSSAINVTFDGASGVCNVDVQNERGVLTEGLTTTDITILESHTMQDVANSINSETNWTATADSNAAKKPGFALLQKRYDIMEEDDQACLTAPLNSFQMIKEVDGRYRVPQMGKSHYGMTDDWESTSPDGGEVAMPRRTTSVIPYQPLIDGPVWLVMYQGGYAASDIPAGLEQLATEISANAFKAISHDSGLKGEKIGDYSYQLADVGDYVRNALHAQKNRLDLYAYKALT